ncbi:MAG: hypothetical protein ACRDOG_16530, partial [Gaiellaceae bacterium]
MSIRLGEMLRGALAGMTAAAAWAVAEPVASRLFRPPPGYSDVRLLGAVVTQRRAWRPVGVALHLGNGALFGAVFERLGGRGVGQGVLAAQAENVALWPGMALADRLHPDRRNGVWPPLLGNGRVFVYEAA